MANLLQNTRTILSNPGMVAAYTRWCISRLRGSGPYVPGPKGVHISERWVGFGEYWSFRLGIDPREQAFMARLSPGIAIDVGANLGLFTAHLAASRFEVHSFEPIRNTFERLQENMKASGLTATLNNAAVGDRDGEASFLVDPRSPATNRLGEGGTVVQISTLDSYMAASGIEKLEFLKVDVEGFEMAVFCGAQEALKEHRIKAVLFEVSNEMLRSAGGSNDLLYDFLLACGYQLFRLDEHGIPNIRLSLKEMNEIELENVVTMPISGKGSDLA